VTFKGLSKNSSLLFATFFAGLLLLVSPAYADNSIFSNVTTGVQEDEGTVGNGAGLEGAYISQAFEFTPTATGVFGDAMIDIYTTAGSGAVAGEDGNATAAIYSSTSGGPGLLLAQLDTIAAPDFASAPLLPFSANATTFTQTSGSAVTLTAGTQYWFVLGPGDANSVYYFLSGAATSNLSVAQQYAPGAAWNVNPFPPAPVPLQIDGAPLAISTPEPSMFVVVFAGFLGMAGYRKRSLGARP
jgi:hypothetical protein